MDFRRWTLVCLLALALAALPALAATTPEQVAAEREGLEGPPPDVLPVPDPVAHQRALGMLPTTGLLLIPESSNDRVMAFDPTTGDLVDADFIPADTTNLSTPIHAVLAADGNSILVSDQIDDVVQQYGLDGMYIGVFAPAGGADTSILDNIRGIEIRASDGHLLVSVGSGTNADAIAEFDTAGNFVGNFVANGAGGLISPFDVYERAADFLVGGITSDAIHSYDATGTYLGDLAPLDTFPEQVGEAANGNVLVGNFSGTQEGVVELTPAGAVVGIYDPAAVGGNRGVYELPNGNILTTNGSGVHEIDRSGNLVETKISGVSARFIEFAVQGGPGEPPVSPLTIPTLSAWGLAILAFVLVGLAMALMRRRRAA